MATETRANLIKQVDIEPDTGNGQSQARDPQRADQLLDVLLSSPRFRGFLLEMYSQSVQDAKNIRRLMGEEPRCKKCGTPI